MNDSITEVLVIVNITLSGVSQSSYSRSKVKLLLSGNVISEDGSFPGLKNGGEFLISTENV
jgi:hypothetical protein